MGGRGQGPPRERATEGAEQGEALCQHGEGRASSPFSAIWSGLLH